VILASGRIGPADISTWLPPASLVVRRLEVGFRIQQSSDSFFLRHRPELDPKYIIPDRGSGVEWRTFCCCREGLIVETLVGGLTTVSGRADCPPTGYSNIGFNLRVSDAGLAVQLWADLRPRLSDLRSAAQQEIRPFLGGAPGPLSTILGPQIAESLRTGLRILEADFGADSLDGAMLVGPTLEGVVTYPAHDEDLAICGVRNAWVAGDAAGDFRGLTAALISGHLAIRSVSIKGVLLMNERPLVYTAQSKHYFYCRDAVCEFVFNREAIPINPFRAFDYFLGDRVGRDKVREGNRRLLSVSDEVWVFGEELADGVLIEITQALEQHKPVKYFSIDPIADKIRPLQQSLLGFELEISENSGLRRDELLDHLTSGTTSSVLRALGRYEEVGGSR